MTRNRQQLNLKQPRERSRKRLWASWLVCVVMVMFSIWGCRSQPKLVDDGVPYIQAATSIEYADVDVPENLEAYTTIRPVSLTSEGPSEFWDLSLEETIHIALQKSKVFRDLGGTVLKAPTTTTTTFDPAILESDPRFGPQAALSAFDATFAASMFYEKNDRALNNEFFGGGTRILEQDAAVFQAQINKKTPFGSEFTLRHNLEFDKNNAPGNQFPSAFDVNFEAEFRQKLLRGGGIDFGRIAGVSETPGVYNGVLIARTNTDMSIADFEMSVRDFISDVEAAYWDLYFAYRNLDAKVAARNSALQTWRRVQALKELGRLGGEADKEAEARGQYYRFQEDVENALSGRAETGFQGNGGVQVAERKLRYLIGLPVNGSSALRPTDEPTRAQIVFDWELSLEESLMKRAELRKQKWMIKRRELELLASRNFLRPELDIVALQRWRGFGQDFLRHDNPTRFTSAWDNLASGDFQETQVGMELSFPFGNRQAHAGVRNAEFLLARERSLLKEQEQKVVHDLSNSVAEIDRAFKVLQTVYNRREADRERLRALQAAFEADKAPLNLVLDAQRRLATAETNYYESLVAYNDAIKDVHYQKGTLLEYTGVHLSEGPWAAPAYADAADKLGRRMVIDGEHLPQHHVISTGAE